MSTTYRDRIKNVKDYLTLPLLHDHWYVAGVADEFGREPVERTILERSIVFYRTEAGELVALQNRCLHRSFPLAESTLDGDELVCGYHGIRYSRDGEIVRVPCQANTSNRRLRRYPVREMGPWAWIWMGDPDAVDHDALPDLEYLDDPGYRTFHAAYPLEGSYLLMMENLNDLTHFAYLHRESFRFDDYFIDLPTTVERTEDGVYCNRIDDDPRRAIGALPSEIRARVAGRAAQRHDGGITVSPGVFTGSAPTIIGDPDEPDEVFMQRITHCVTPVTQTSARYYWAISNDFAIDDDRYYEATEAFITRGFEEDRWAVAHMQRLLDQDTTPMTEMSIAGDKAGLLFRRRVLEWVVAEHGAAPAESTDVPPTPVAIG